MRAFNRKSIELFAGAGGLGIGLSQAGFEPQVVVEYDKWCCDTLRDNRKILIDRRSNRVGSNDSWKILEGDVREASFLAYENQLDLVSGGPPCQPFSLGGKHRAFDDARDMFPQAVRAVLEAKPKAFIFENVKGLMRASFQNYFEYVQLQLEHPELTKGENEDWEDHYSRLEQHHTSSRRCGLNYKVVTRLLNSANYGVPQRRERVLFVGFRDDIDAQWTFGKGNFSQEALVWDQMFGNYWERHKIRKRSRKLEGRALQISKRLSQDEKPESQPWRTTRDAFSGLPDLCQKQPKSSITHHDFQGGARSYPGHTGSYLDEPSKTLKAGVHGVPGGENMLRRADGSIRYFSTREAARLQTFPDGYTFHGAWSECMRQLGNAVPVELARVVGVSVAEKLDA